MAVALAVGAATFVGVPVAMPAVAAVPTCRPGPPGPATGYSIVAADGGVFSFGEAPFAGSLAGSTQPHGRVVGVVANPLGSGYSMATDLGEVFGFGGFGTAANQSPTRLPVSNVVGVAATPSGKGGWLAAADGGVFALGDAKFLGSLGSTKLNQPVVAIAPTPSGKGYWLVAADGGIFSFGDAGFFGSTGSLTLQRPIVAVTATPSGAGYWLVAGDGGVFSFGDAGFFGSTGATTLALPVVGITASPTGRGYWLVAADGGVFSFGDAGFLGSTGGMKLNAPIVGMTATRGPEPCTGGPKTHSALHVSLSATNTDFPADGSTTFTVTIHNRSDEPAYFWFVGVSVVDPAGNPLWEDDGCVLRPAVVPPFSPLAPGTTVSFDRAYPDLRPGNKCPLRLPVLFPGDYEAVARVSWCTSALLQTDGWYCFANLAGSAIRLPIRITPPLVEPVCRNSYQPLCGMFRWDPEPKNEPITLSATPSSTDVRVGEEVTMRIIVDDPDSADMAALHGTNVYWGEPSGVSNHADFRCDDERFGPWDPPAPAPGHSEKVETHTYWTPGTYTVSVRAGSGHGCLFGDDDYNPYASSASTSMTIVVRPADDQS